jgi:PIN domain nuclease of toxin-antitoxin system
MILLDTHILLWWINDSSRLSQRARKVVESEKENELDLNF